MEDTIVLYYFHLPPALLFESSVVTVCSILLTRTENTTGIAVSLQDFTLPPVLSLTESCLTACL
jgi:hypothetical protein